MAKKKPHKFEIKSKDPGSILTGMNTLLFMDGKLLRGCTGFKFQVDARGIARVVIEMVGDAKLKFKTNRVKTRKRNQNDATT